MEIDADTDPAREMSKESRPRGLSGKTPLLHDPGKEKSPADREQKPKVDLAPETGGGKP